MTQEEANKIVEEEIAYHMDEFGLEREEAIDIAHLNFSIKYIHGEYSKEEVALIFNAFGEEIDWEDAEKQKQQYQHQVELRRQRKLRKKQKGGQ